MHEQLLLAALEQAKLEKELCTPNSSVGAVAVQNGTIIAQAWQQDASHAEQLLLARIPPKIPGISVSITLEPYSVVSENNSMTILRAKWYKGSAHPRGMI